VGLLKHLLFWPVTGPSFLARFSLEKVQDTVRQELTDDGRIKDELLTLQMQLELGEIDDAQYLEREADLMRQLREVREWREEFGMGLAGGPVQVAGSGHADPAAEEDASNPARPDDADVQVHLGFDDEPRD
jgi:hypothetical protein